METMANKAGGKTYRATSLQDMASFFELLAQKEEQLARGPAQPQREKAKHQAAANAYRDVASMVNDMELTNEGIAKMVKERIDGSRREPMLDALMELMSMSDLDALQERLP